MDSKEYFSRAQFKTPRAAAVAGIVFSILFMSSMVMIRISVPEDVQESGEWLARSWKTVGLALNLLPFAGVAFLWFVGVLRDRLGVKEDRLFSTVFLGSGILFLSMLFVFAAIAGGLIVIYGMASDKLMGSAVYAFGRTVTREIIQVYAMKMAGVFMILTSTLSIRTGFLPRWMALLGYVLAFTLLLSFRYSQWIILVFPLWVLLLSIYLLLSDTKAEVLSVEGKEGRTI